MSKIISFRLNPDNPREAKALEILTTKQLEGFSCRRILTDALINQATEIKQFPIDEFKTTLEQISELLEQLNYENHIPNQSTHPKNQVATLNDNFLKSVKVAAKPGLNFFDS